MKLIKIISILSLGAVILSCNNEESLQTYYVDNQQDADFLAVDVPTSLFTNVESLDADQKETLESVKKINVLALKKETDPLKFEDEKLKLDKIFSDDKYQLLMKYGGAGRKAELYFTGKDDAIDELIIYGYDDNQGLGIARVLGNDMNPQKIMQMMKSLEKGDIDMGGIKNVVEIFGNTTTSKDSVNFEIEKSSDTL